MLNNNLSIRYDIKCYIHHNFSIIFINKRRSWTVSEITNFISAPFHPFTPVSNASFDCDFAFLGFPGPVLSGSV